MARDPVCGKELDEATSYVKTIVKGKTHHFCSESCLTRFYSIKHPAQRNLSSVVLGKTFSELFAIGTGIGGIIYTLQEIAVRALIMDTVSALAAIVALTIGIENLRYLKAHNLVRRAVLLAGLGILISIVILVWHSGSHL